MTGEELSRDLFSLEEQITAQVYVWSASIGIDSEVLDEARFDDTTEDIVNYPELPCFCPISAGDHTGKPSGGGRTNAPAKGKGK